jgi:hypothetical protein
MNEDETITQNSLFKGKKIELASTSGVELVEDIGEEFMFCIIRDRHQIPVLDGHRPPRERCRLHQDKRRIAPR